MALDVGPVCRPVTGETGGVRGPGAWPTRNSLPSIFLDTTVHKTRLCAPSPPAERRASPLDPRRFASTCDPSPATPAPSPPLRFYASLYCKGACTSCNRSSTSIGDSFTRCNRSVTRIRGTFVACNRSSIFSCVTITCANRSSTRLGDALSVIFRPVTFICYAVTAVGERSIAIRRPSDRPRPRFVPPRAQRPPVVHLKTCAPARHAAPLARPSLYRPSATGELGYTAWRWPSG